MVSRSTDRVSNLPIRWLPWLLPPPLLLLLLPRFSAEPTSLPANSSFMSPPRVTLPGHANSRIFLAREPPSMSLRPLRSFSPPWRRGSSFPSAWQIGRSTCVRIYWRFGRQLVDSGYQPVTKNTSCQWGFKKCVTVILVASSFSLFCPRVKLG